MRRRSPSLRPAAFPSTISAADSRQFCGGTGVTRFPTASTINMTEASIPAFLRNVRTTEMAEAFFARLVVVVEGPSEREAMPILCAAQRLNFDRNGISIVAAGGKSVIDTLVQLYQAHEIRVYTIFDNDKRKPPSARGNGNKVLCRLLGIPESDLPAGEVSARYAVLDGNWEEQMKAALATSYPGCYEALETSARKELGIRGDGNKPLVARYVAEHVVMLSITLPFISDIVARLKVALGLVPEVPGPATDEDDIPF
jgi:putative ATP-dependent endonuclease of the OLD family